MISLSEAVSHASSFLRTTAGMWAIGDLERVDEKADRWVICFKRLFSDELLVVEINKEGKPLAYRKEKKGNTA